jgi:hypothetical protein
MLNRKYGHFEDSQESNQSSINSHDNNVEKILKKRFSNTKDLKKALEKKMNMYNKLEEMKSKQEKPRGT